MHPLEIEKIQSVAQLELLAQKMMEGYLIGLHRSPLSGFSSEFREHKNYNPGDPLKYIDQKVLAKSDKLFIKRFDEQTNMNVIFVLDISSSMHYPKEKKQQKIHFSIIAIISLIQLLKKQRDTFGLITFDDQIVDYLPAKNTLAHYQEILHILFRYFKSDYTSQPSQISNAFSDISRRIKKKSMLLFFSDFMQDTLNETQIDKISASLNELSYAKHEIKLFNVLHKGHEALFDFKETMVEFVDLETADIIKLNPQQFQMHYREEFQKNQDNFQKKCLSLGIRPYSVSVEEDYYLILEVFLKKFNHVAS
ncbi:MAG: DUF58 domain-containing protein [Chitinophagales bacterium]|jgi:uncharacterized protein (DUF58 family)|nr:DUF58 domain-containing protein [Chitinophagales bacterium]